MVSYRQLMPRLASGRPLPRAACRWALDSGAYTELAMHGRWMISPERYVADVARCQRETGLLDWAAPMDWPCEPDVRLGGSKCAGTGLSTRGHQHYTVLTYLYLRQRWRLESDLPCPIIPRGAGLDSQRVRLLRRTCTSARASTCPHGRWPAWDRYAAARAPSAPA
jgi:hypothetical protein